MRPSTVLLAAFIALANAQSPVATFGGSGTTTTIAGAATGPNGAIYVAGTTGFPGLPLGHAAQPEFGDAVIMRSADLGATWTRAGIPEANVNVVVPDSLHPGVLFAAGNAGIYKTTNTGKTWRKVYTIDSSYPGIQSLVIDPANPSHLAATIPEYSPAKGVIVSRDAGETWTPAAFACPNPPCAGRLYAGRGILIIDPYGISRDWGQTVQPFNAGGWTTALALHPVWQGHIYAATAQGVMGRLRLSKDYGATWTDLAVPSGIFSALYAIAVDPDNPDSLYAATIEGLYRSTNGGIAWSRVADALVAAVPDRSAQLSILPSACSGGGIFAVGSGMGVARGLVGGTRWSTDTATASTTSIAASGCDLYITRRISTDAFVAKLRPDGSTEWATFLGGANADSALGIAIDRAGYVYVIGNTSSADFPFTQRQGTLEVSNGFLTRFTPDGAVEWSAGIPAGTAAIALDRDGNPFVTGTSRTASFLTEGAMNSTLNNVNGAGEGYVARFTTNGRLAYATFLGTPEGLQIPSSIAVNANGEAIVSGYGFESSEIYRPRASIIRLNAAGTGYLGRSTVDETPAAIALDPNGGVWISASRGAYSTLPPGYVTCTSALPGGPEVYIEERDPATLARRRTISLGRGCAGAGGPLNIDEAGTITVAFGAGSGFPLRNPMFGASVCVSGMGSMIARVRPDGSPTFSSYLNGCGVPSGLGFSPDGRIILPVTQAGLAALLAVPAASQPAIALDLVANAFSGDSAGIVAGGLYTLFASPLEAEWHDSGLNAPELPVALNNLSVTFDDVPARLVQTGSGRVIVVAPDVLPAGLTTIQISLNGASSNPVSMPVLPLRPALLTRGFPSLPDGPADGNIRNEDGTLNGPDNPAARGSTIRIFGTAIGATEVWSTWNADYRAPEHTSPVAGFASGIQEIFVTIPPGVSVDETGRAQVAISPHSPMQPSRLRTYSNAVLVYVE